MKRLIFLFPLIATLLAGCESWDDEKSLPPGRGRPGEVLLVIDSLKWHNRIGSELRITFNETVEGLPRDQSMFELRHVAPFDFKSILLHARNLVLLIPLYDETSQDLRMRNFFNKSSIDSMGANPDLFIVIKRNLFATDQQVMFLIGRSPGDFVDKIIRNREAIRKFFNDVEERRAARNLYAIKEEKIISSHLKKEYNFDMRVPYSFKIAQNSENFVWLRLPGQQIDKNIVIISKDYLDIKEFELEDLLRWRNEVFREQIFGDPENPESYVKTETIIPPVSRKVTFNGKYSIQIRGLWKTNNISMGGPFISYAFVDQALNRLYYIEGFIYSPGEDQRELMRETDVTLKTFRTSDMKEN
jgi:hypothetical protein